MRSFWNKSVDANISNQTLVVAFRKANPPMIWQFDLERNHSFTLALQGEEGDWELGITSPKGDFYPITRFLNKEAADEAFEKVQKALTRHKSGWGKWIGRTILGIFILIVIGILGFLGMTGYSFYSLQKSAMDYTAMRSPMAIQPQFAEQPDGTPVHADQILVAPNTAPQPPAYLQPQIQNKFEQQPIADDGSPLPADQLLEAPKD